MENCIPPLVFIVAALAIFGAGILAGRQQGKDKCMEQVHKIVQHYENLNSDENIGDC